MAKSQNSKFKCFSGILRSLLCISNLPTQPSDPTTDIPTTTTTFENPKKNFKTQVKTPRVVTRLIGLDSLPNPRKVFSRKEDQKEKSGCKFVTLHVDGRPPNVIARLMCLDGQPHQQPLHRQHKGFSETYGQWTASVSSQRDGKPYEHRSNRKDSMAQQECNDEYDVLETSKVEMSSYPAKRTINSKLSEAEMAFIQQKFMADHGLTQLCSGSMQTSWSSRLLKDSKERNMQLRSGFQKTFGQVLECLDNENLEHLAMMERLLGPLPQHMIISAKSQNSKFKCFSGILRCLLCIGSLPTQPSDPTTNIPTTTTTFENPKKNFKTQVKTLGVDARLMGLDSLPDPRKYGRPPNVIARLMGLDGLPHQQPRHTQHSSRKLIDNGLHQYHRKGMENHMNTDQIGKTQWRSKNVRISMKFWEHQRS
ncbi:unnamed protein product [Camellia sinensis]